MNILKFAKVAAVGVAALFAVPASAATIDLGFALDESGSVSNSEYALIRDGLAAALAQVPVSGPNTYRISIVNFQSSARTIVPVTSINSQADLTSVINTLTTTTRLSGGTNIGSGIDLLTANFVAAGIGDTSVLNVATDGTGGSPGAAGLRAFDAGIDSLSFEAIGGVSTTSLLNAAFPGTPELIVSGGSLPDDILTNSFVLEVATFADFEGAIAAKVGRVIENTGGGDPGVVPLPAGLPLLLTGLAGFAALRRTRRKAAA